MGRERKELIYMILLFMLSCVLNMWLFPLHQEEPRRAIIALEMIFRKNFWQPTVLMVPYFLKPPLQNLLIAAASLFSPKFVSELTVRLPSLLSGAVLAFSIFYFLEDFIGKKRAFYASLITMTFAEFMYCAVQGEPDMLFATFVFLSVGTFIKFYKKNLLVASFLGFLFTSLALLTKGLPAVYFFLAAVAVILWCDEGLKRLISFQFLLGIAGLAPFIAWLYKVPTGKALKALIAETAKRTAVESKILHFLMYIPKFPLLLLIATAPWSLLLIYYLLKDKNLSGIKLKLFGNKTARLFTLLAIVELLPFILSPGTRARYLLPALPFIGILLAFTLKDDSIALKRALGLIQWPLDFIVIIGIIASFALTLNPSVALEGTVMFLIPAYLARFFLPGRVDVRNRIILTAIISSLFMATYTGYYLAIASYRYPKFKQAGHLVAKLTEGKKLFSRTRDLRLCFYAEKYRTAPIYNGYVYKPTRGAFLISDKPQGKIVKIIKIKDHVFYLGKVE